MRDPELVVVTVSEGEYSTFEPDVDVFIVRKEDLGVFLAQEEARDRERAEASKRLNVPQGYQKGYWESEAGRERMALRQRENAESAHDLAQLRAKAIPSTHYGYHVR